MAEKTDRLLKVAESADRRGISLDGGNGYEVLWKAHVRFEHLGRLVGL